MEMSLLDYHMSMEKHKVLMYYKGPFDEVILAKISEFLRGKFEEAPRAGKKLFAIFMELAQNISYYSAEVNHFDSKEEKGKVGTIVIHEGDKAFKLTAGNLVSNEVVEDIVDRCNEINSLDHEGLRALKREVITQPRKEGQRGAHIGLIQVALKAEQPLNIEVQRVDDDSSFFIISIDILKD
jgi:hypothetical protein